MIKRDTMKILNYKPLLVMVLLVIIFFNTSVTYAADYYLCGQKINGGVGNYGYNARYYWTDSGLSTAQNNRCDDAMISWVRTTSSLGYTTPICYYRTTAKSSSSMDVYRTSMPERRSNAWTEYWSKSANRRVDPSKENWSYNIIYINQDYYKQLASTDVRRSVFAHEMGHCFGLDENNSRNDVIMCQMGSGRSVNNPSIRDLRGINALYQ